VLKKELVLEAEAISTKGSKQIRPYLRRRNPQKNSARGKGNHTRSAGSTFATNARLGERGERRSQECESQTRVLNIRRGTSAVPSIGNAKRTKKKKSEKNRYTVDREGGPASIDVLWGASEISDRARGANGGARSRENKDTRVADAGGRKVSGRGKFFQRYISGPYLGTRVVNVI